jgi:hypothetical protein
LTKPVDLDQYRAMVAGKSTEIRRRLQEVEAEETVFQRRKNEVEAFLIATPAANWPQAAAKARYLLQVFASTLDIDDCNGQRLIERTLDDLVRLSGTPVCR